MEEPEMLEALEAFKEIADSLLESFHEKELWGWEVALAVRRLETVRELMRRRPEGVY